MGHYILECIAFQLTFLLIYDFFLKGETFFQWNRCYLLGTYVLSILLPIVRIEAFKEAGQKTFGGYPAFLWNSQDTEVTLGVPDGNHWQLSWQEGILYAGMFLAAMWFFVKIRQLHVLKKRGKQVIYPNYTQIIVQNSAIAFSFFRSIFLGDKVVAKEHRSIIAHELVHIKQGHTWDLLFFELMRIIGWFNPLVYVYQSRTAELHEFIADAKVAKDHKKEHYEQLLLHVFQTEHISFINQFFTKSLIKKRIVMLQKTKSKKIWHLKYLLLVPVIMGMLVYTSCENNPSDSEKLGEVIVVGAIENMTVEEEKEVFTKLIDLSVQPKDWEFMIKDQHSTILFTKPTNESSFISGPGGIPIKASMQITSKILGEDFSMFDTEVGNKIKLESMVSFAVADEVPVFPGCENAADKRACFNEMMQRHISKNFSYPVEAQKAGIEGRVSVMFIIDKKGSVSHLQMRGPDKVLEQEVQRIISKLPKMTPGMDKGKVVDVPFSIPVVFKLDTDTDSAIQLKNNDYGDGIPFAVVENVPIFPGCENSKDKRACFNEKIQQHIGKNFKYPLEAQKGAIQGRVGAMFMITEEGTIANIEMRGPDELLEDEVERIINRLPNMSPGENAGRPVNVIYSIPVNFKLQ